MSQSPPVLADVAIPLLRNWIASLIASGVLATLGLALAATLCNNAFIEGYANHRTIWAILAMAVGLLGPLAPFILFASRQRFLQLPQPQQRIALAAVPGVQVILLVGALIGLAIGTKYDHPPIIPYAETLVLQFGRHDGRDSELLHCYTKPPRGGTLGFDPYDFTAKRGQEDSVHLKGKITRAAGHQVQFEGVLTITEKFRLRLDGLEEVTITVGGPQRGLSEIDLEPGRYPIEIRGRAQ